MARTGGEKTKRKILSIAEKLFADKGYDGTSIQTIATTAKVNKALIYYHFKNKQDIIDSLFEQTLEDMFTMQGNVQEKVNSVDQTGIPEERIKTIIDFLSNKKKILTVMLMEALKNEKGYQSLFQCADLVISKNVSEVIHSLEKKKGKKIEREELLMHEFYTGFLPIVFFAIFKDKWAHYFKCDRSKMIALFVKVFTESHIRHTRE